MSIKSFLTFKNLFGNLSEEEEKTLHAETVLMVLAGAANADLNMESVETNRISKILKERFDLDLTPTEIKIKGALDLSSTEIVAKHVRSACNHLSVKHRQEILELMLEVFRSDGSVGALEQAYFNAMVEALELSPAEMMQV